MNKALLLVLLLLSTSTLPAAAFDPYDVSETVWNRNIEKLQTILKIQPQLATTIDRDMKEYKTRTPLTSVARAGWMAGAMLLLQYKADVNVGDPPPLNLAAESGSVPMVELLLSRGANVHGKDKQGRTALRQAVWNHRSSVANILLSKGANTDVFINAGLGRVSAIRKALIVRPDLIKARDLDERTLMHWAAANNQKEIAELLERNGANLNARDILSQTPLQQAIDTHSNEMVKWLIVHGACPKKNGYQADPKDFAHGQFYGSNGYFAESAIQSAVRANNLVAAQMLLDAGVSPNTKGIDGGTALHLTVILGSKQMAELLIKNGADVNLGEDQHTPRINDSPMPDPGTLYTPLHWAVYENRKDMVELLLQHKANVNARTSKMNGQQTPLGMALSDAEKKDIASILRKHGGKI